MPFVIISGDSDFSPLISKFKENAKSVIGIGVRDSSSSLLVSNCDEFIFYEDIVQIKPQQAPAKTPPIAKPTVEAVKDIKASREAGGRESHESDAHPDAGNVDADTVDKKTRKHGLSRLL